MKIPTYREWKYEMQILCFTIIYARDLLKREMQIFPNLHLVQVREYLYFYSYCHGEEPNRCKLHAILMKFYTKKHNLDFIKSRLLHSMDPPPTCKRWFEYLFELIALKISFRNRPMML